MIHRGVQRVLDFIRSVRLGLACLLTAALLSSCGETGGPQKEREDPGPAIKSVDVEQALALQEHQAYDIFDYRDGSALLLIWDQSRQNPMDINDQVRTTFYEEFVLLDLSSGTTESFPVQTFGICPSALSAFDGIIFSFFTVSSEQTLTASICYLDHSGMRSICEGGFSPFGMGPVLQHYDGGVLFSYLDETGETFGVTKITETFGTEPVLRFDAGEADYISDDFRASDGSYGYTVGEEGRVTFYLGTSDGKERRISLPEGRKIHGFDVSGDRLVVSLAGDAAETITWPGLQVFDLDTGACILEKTDNAPALYPIAVNERGRLCGFSGSQLKAYICGEQLEEQEIDAPDISGSFFKILSHGDDFLAAAYGFDKDSEFWLLSFGNTDGAAPAA